MATSPDDVFYTCPDQSSRAIRMFSLVRQLLEYIKWCYTRPFARKIFIKATVLDQCCNKKQCCSNVVTLCSAEYRGCQSSRVTLALATKLDNERLNEVGRLCSNSRQNCLLLYYLLACEKESSTFPANEANNERMRERAAKPRGEEENFLFPPLAPTSPFACRTRVTSRDSPEWKGCSQAKLLVTSYYLLSEAPALILFEGAPSRPAANCIEKQSRCLKAALCVEF